MAVGRNVLNSLKLNKADSYLIDCTHSLERSAVMLHIIDSTVDPIREKHKKEELYYRVLYYAYFCRTNMKTAAKACMLLKPRHCLFHRATTTYHLNHPLVHLRSSFLPQKSSDSTSIDVRIISAIKDPQIDSAYITQFSKFILPYIQQDYEQELAQKDTSTDSN